MRLLCLLLDRASLALIVCNFVHVYHLLRPLSFSYSPSQRTPRRYLLPIYSRLWTVISRDKRSGFEDEDFEEGDETVGKSWTDASSSHRSLYNPSGTTTSDRYDCRSIVSYMFEDELDRQAAQVVDSALATIDSAMFDDASEDTALSGALQQECEEWRTTFVHLRVRGAQIAPSNETGIQVTARSTVLHLTAIRAGWGTEMENGDGE